ncbi:hypothetical protein O3M35_008839 [Rhynocoris fuscipes]|uniref:Uncharacterized protein n=1 Tax=Rhynocoris fuscipes TaxID=488301 RepID=A0AAW1D969_9HEMI
MVSDYQDQCANIIFQPVIIPQLEDVSIHHSIHLATAKIVNVYIALKQGKLKMYLFFFLIIYFAPSIL